MPLITIDGSSFVGGGPINGLVFASGSLGSSVDRVAFTDWSTGNAAGVTVESGASVAITGSLLGTDSTGAGDLGNYVGISVIGSATIGGTTPAARNIISGNVTGVFIGGTASVKGNWIGVGLDGTSALPNNFQGVFAQSFGPSGVVGGTLPGEGNVISRNGGPGVRLISAGTSVAVRGNSIGGNGGLGIDLDPTGATLGVTANDPPGNLDDDLGANALQNFPVLTDAAVSGDSLDISGALDSAADQTYHIDFYASDACDPSGNGEGEGYLGSTDATTNGSGHASFATSFAPASGVVTATATDGTGNTSEFSACTTISTGGAGGSLSGSSAPFIPPTSLGVDLTAEGTADWAIWGYAAGGTSTSLAPDARKAGGSAISDLTNIDPPPSVVLRGLGQFPSPPFLFSWTDGSGPASATNVSAGLQHNGGPPPPPLGQNLSTLNHGFGFTVPAGTTTRTLKVYVATNRAAGQLTATLSDGSAPPYVNTLPIAADLHSSVYTITYAAASEGQELEVEWIETADNCPAFRCDNAAIYAVALSGAPNPPPVATSVNLTAGSPSAQAGAARVELDAVPPEALLGGTSGPNAAPLNSIPINSIPIGSIPIGSIPIGSIPIGSIGLGTALPFLADVALSTIPLTPPLTWEAILAGTTLANLSLQQVTLAQVLGNTAAAGNLASVPIGSIQLQRSPIGSIPIGSIPIGSIPIGSIAVPQNPDAPATSDILTRWCQWLSGPPINCVGNGGALAGTTIISLALQGAPIGSIPIGSIPIGSIPIGSIPIGSIPLGSIPIGSITVQRLSIAFSPIGSIPIGSIPIGSIPIGSIPIGSIPIGSINLQSSPIGSIPIGSIAQPNSVFVGSPAGPLLRDVPAGQFLPGVTFETLLRASAPGTWNAITFTDLILHTDPAVLHGYTVAQLVNSLPPGGDTTYADVLALLIQESDLGWEQLDLPSTDLQTVATEGGSIAYHASFALGSATGPVPTQVDVLLPSGFRYDPDSARWSRGGIDQGPLTPTELPSGALRFAVPTTVDATYAIDLTVHPGITLGPQSAGLEVTPQPGVGTKVADPTPPIVNVTDTFEANGTPAQGKLLSTDSLYLSYLPGGADIDLYRFTIPAAGTRTTFRLSHLPVDYDLVVYGPNGQQLVTPVAGTPPVDGEPLADGGYATTHATDPLAPQTLDDVTLLPLPVLGVSTQRGTEDDAVVVVSDEPRASTWCRSPDSTARAVTSPTCSEPRPRPRPLSCARHLASAAFRRGAAIHRPPR